MAGVPSTLVGGDMYYLADGTYHTYVAENASGSGTVTVRKAISSDHCTDTGWNSSTMGSSQAVFAPSGSSNYGVALRIRVNNFTLDGNGRTSLGSGYGIKLDGSLCDSNSSFCWTVAVGDTGSVSGALLKYIEIVGSGANDTANLAHPDQNISIRSSSGFTFSYGYIHDSSGDPVEMVAGSNNIQVDHSYIWKNDSTPTNHGECIAANGSVSNVFIFDNVLQDCEGTSFIDALNSGGSTTDNNWQIYNNVMLYSPNNASGRKGVGDGAISCDGNGVSQACTNWGIYHNTFLNIGGGSASGTGGIVWQGGSGTTGTPDIRDNFFWNNLLTTVISVPAGSTLSYNSCVGPNDSGACTGTASINTSSITPTPFVNWQALNFNLASDNTNWNNGSSLVAPYNADANGTLFVSSRGAYQYTTTSSTTSAPVPPSNLVAVVQ